VIRRHGILAGALLAFAFGTSPAHALECEDVFSKVRQDEPLAPFVVGDSVTVPAGDFLGEMGFAVDAVACRTFAQGLEVMAARGRLPDTVVMALGSNGEVSAEELSYALELVGPFGRLVLVAPKELGGGPDPDGRLFRAFEQSHPDQVSVLDWPAYSAGNGGWFAPDGLHITTDGARGFAEMINEAIEFAPPAQIEPPQPPPRPRPKPRAAAEPQPSRLLADIWAHVAAAIGPPVVSLVRFAADVIGPVEVGDPDL